MRLRFHRRALLPIFTLVLSLVFRPTLVGADTGAWTQWARKVGPSETAAARAQALARLRKEKDLDRKLLGVLDSPDRVLALEVISALQLKSLVPELLKRVEADPDGFLTLNLNALLDLKNKDQVLGAYQKSLVPERQDRISSSVIVAMLEPLGRIGTRLPKASLDALSAHPSPEVRAALLSYLRLHSLRHGRRDEDKRMLGLLESREFQLRLQAVAVLGELSRTEKGGPITAAELKKRCRAEDLLRIQTQCLLLVDDKRVDP